MEENIAMLIADLSGYTALTEIHGSLSAANLIDKYISIVKTCLAGDSILLERTGDEVLLISSSPDFLLATATMILEKTSREDKFLQLHGGLHYGKALKRDGHYFGSALNLTSRIAGKASPGSFWCSAEFVNSVSIKNHSAFCKKGKHHFKNVTEQKQLYEVINDNKNPYLIDSICRMLIIDRNKAVRHPGKKDVFFCSPDCLAIYRENESVIAD